MDHPLIHGGSRTTWSAAIVLACIVLAGLAIILLASFPSAGPSAGLLVGGPVFF